MKNQVKVLVTGVTGGGVGFGILETLMNAGYQAFGADVTAYSVGLIKAKKGFVVPLATDSRYLDAIQSICAKNGINLVIPGSEAELFELTKNTSQFESRGILVIANDHALIKNCRDKWDMFLMFKNEGIPCPDSALPESYGQFIGKHGFPILLKQRTGSGSRNLFVAKNEQDYVFYSKRLNEEKIPFILQEYIGEGADEYTVGVVCRKDKSVVGSITVHRLLSGLSSKQKTSAGKATVEISTGISQGIVEDNELIQRQCEDYAKKLGVTGPANFQGRLVNNVFIVFELNPRFSGTTPFRAGVGFNDVDLVIRDRLGEVTKKPEFKKGIIVLRSLENVFVPIEKIKEIERYSK